MAESKGEVTQLLERIAGGDHTAEQALMSQVYFELHKIACVRLQSERAQHTLQPTALVHEAYLRLCGTGAPACQDRTHFFRLAARVMRRILIDYARQRNAEKRGDGFVEISLDNALAVTSEQCHEALEIDELINRLAELSPRQATVVELRYFGGMSEEEIAVAIGKNVRTVRRDWAMARAWFRQQMRQQ